MELLPDGSDRAWRKSLPILYIQCRDSIHLSYGRAAQSESKTFCGVRRTLFDFEIEQLGNAVSRRGRDQKSDRHAVLVTLEKISMVLERYGKSCCLGRTVIRSRDRDGG